MVQLLDQMQNHILKLPIQNYAKHMHTAGSAVAVVHVGINQFQLLHIQRTGEKWLKLFALCRCNNLFSLPDNPQPAWGLSFMAQCSMALARLCVSGSDRWLHVCAWCESIRAVLSRFLRVMLHCHALQAKNAL